jgi:hypothetical protein
VPYLSKISTNDGGFYTAKPTCACTEISSIDDIAKIAESLTEENAILIAQTEINCLDNLSLKGDIPEDISNTEYKIDS